MHRTLCESAHGHTEFSAAQETPLDALPGNCLQPRPWEQLPPGISSRQSSALHFSSVGPCALNAGSGLVHWAQRSDIHPACVFAGDAGAFHPQGAMLEEGPRIVFLMRLAIAGPSVQ